MRVVLGIYAGFMFAGIVLTYLVPETKGKSLEQLSGEDDINADDINGVAKF